MAEYLPGCPSKRLVRNVRSVLWSFGIRPQGEPWRLTWLWAHEIAISYWHTTWPAASEIASLYLLLLLGQMDDCRTLRLPYRADEKVPHPARRIIDDADWLTSLDLTARRKRTNGKGPA